MELFSTPKVPGPVPVINTTDAQNQVNGALVRRLQAGGSNADNTGAPAAATAAPRAPTLTGLN